MVTKVEKWGKGYGIRLSKRILNDANLDAGEKLAGSLLVIRQPQGRHLLDGLGKPHDPNTRLPHPQPGDPVVHCGLSRHATSSTSPAAVRDSSV